MPSANTFSIAPIEKFVQRWIVGKKWIADPFARNNTLAAITNDIDPNTSAMYHLDAELFLTKLKGMPIEVVLFDPPYSPRQISECYKNIHMEVGMKETQNGALYKRVRDAIDYILLKDGIVLSFGWNSNGMGITRGYRLEELLLVAHGSAHNDTICIAERKL